MLSSRQSEPVGNQKIRVSLAELLASGLAALSGSSTVLTVLTVVSNTRNLFSRWQLGLSGGRGRFAFSVAMFMHFAWLIAPIMLWGVAVLTVFVHGSWLEC